MINGCCDYNANSQVGGTPNSNNCHTSTIMVSWLPVQGWLLVSIADKLYLAITVCVVISGPYMHYSCKGTSDQIFSKINVLLAIIVIIVVHIFTIAHANTTVQHLKKCILRSMFTSTCSGSLRCNSTVTVAQTGRFASVGI